MALAIVAGSMVSLLTVVGSATDDVIRTVRQRKLRYLMQLQLGDILTRATVPPEEESELMMYEEGMHGDFRDFASPGQPEEYDNYVWTIPVLRDEIITGAPLEADELIEAGFVEDSNGRITGRPVSRDMYSDLEEEEFEMPEGQLKRVLVFTVRYQGETAEDDLVYSIMTYLPYPGEEEPKSGGEQGEGAGEPGGGPGGAGDRSSSTSSSSSDAQDSEGRD